MAKEVIQCFRFKQFDCIQLDLQWIRNETKKIRKPHAAHQIYFQRISYIYSKFSRCLLKFSCLLILWMSECPNVFCPSVFWWHLKWKQKLRHHCKAFSSSSNGFCLTPEYFSMQIYSFLIMKLVQALISIGLLKILWCFLVFWAAPEFLLLRPFANSSFLFMVYCVLFIVDSWLLLLDCVLFLVSCLSFAVPVQVLKYGISINCVVPWHCWH